jgi:hypothetical protein
VKDGTFVHQTKYTKDMLRKFQMQDVKPMSTPMKSTATLDADEDGEPVDQREYRRVIGSLPYLTATRPDKQFSVCLCTRFQASPRTSHRQAIKRIFRYLQSAPGLGLWYSSSSTLSLHGFLMRISLVAELRGSLLLVLASFLGLRWFRGLPASSLV